MLSEQVFAFEQDMAEIWRHEELTRVYGQFMDRVEFDQMVEEGIIYQEYAGLFRNPSDVLFNENILEEIDELRKNNWKGKLSDFESDYDLIAKYIYHSNAIEGISLTLSETLSLMEQKQSIPSNQFSPSHLQVLNHLKSYQLIIESVKNKIPLSETLILQLHSILMNNLLESSGEYRRNNVGIRGKKVLLADFYELDGLMKKFIRYINSNTFENSHPIQKACLIHYNFIKIHPFQDGNGRLVRLLMNYVLLKENYPILIIDHEERLEYFNSIEEHFLQSQTILPFESSLCNFITLRMKDSISLFETKNQNQKLDKFH